jgi:hypothetical protein
MSLSDHLIPEVQRILLDRVRVATRRSLSPSVAESVELRTWQDDLFGGMVYEIRAHVLAEKLPPEQVTKSTTIEDTQVVNYPTPATWWDHWKVDHADRWWAGWFARRFPPAIEARAKTVEFKRDVTLTVDLQRYRSYPEATFVPPPNLGAPVAIHTLNATWRSR